MSNQTPETGNVNEQPQGRQNQPRMQNNRRDQRQQRPEGQGQRQPQGQTIPQNRQSVQPTGDSVARNFRNRRNRPKTSDEMTSTAIQGSTGNNQSQGMRQDRTKRIDPKVENRADAKSEVRSDRIDNKSDVRNDSRPQRFNKPRMEAPRPRVKREESVDDIRADIEQVEKDIELEIKQIRAIKLGL